MKNLHDFQFSIAWHNFKEESLMLIIIGLIHLFGYTLNVFHKIFRFYDQIVGTLISKVTGQLA